MPRISINGDGGPVHGRIPLPSLSLVFGFVLSTLVLSAPRLGTIDVGLYCLCVCAAAYLERDRILRNPCAKIFAVFLVLGLLSVVWSLSRGATLYYGLQVVLTVLGGVTVASSRDPYESLVGVSLAFIGHSVLSHVFGQYVPWEDGQIVFVGIDGQKNFYGGVSGITTLLSLGLSFACLHRGKWILTLVGVAGIFVGALGLLRSHAMGFTLTTLLSASILIYFSFYRALSDRVRFGLMTYLVYAGVCSAAIIFMVRKSLLDLVLSVTHKDMTFTGRTDIWLVANEAIAHRPILGTGQNAFWVRGNPYAEKIWVMTGHPIGITFSLHNTYYDLLVTMGVVGLVVFLAVISALLVIQIRQLLKTPTTVQVGWFAVGVFFLFLSGIENFAPMPMNYCTFIMAIGLTFYWRPLRALAVRPAQGFSNPLIETPKEALRPPMLQGMEIRNR